LDASILDRAFHPFVSHGKENGTGLGLTIAEKVVQDHSGELQVEQSSPGCTIMRITLPTAPVATAVGARTGSSQT
jgi:nitrogen-specific signal transduction histidine kinase